MSWQPYVENLTTAGLKAAALVGLPNAVWAKSAEFPNATPQELSALAGGFASDPRTGSSLSATGATIGGVKFAVVMADADCIQLKEKNVNNAEHFDARGVFVYKCNKCMVIGLHDKTLQAGAAKNAVGKVKDYLTSQQY